MLFISSSNDDRLDYGVIICTFGVRYRYYCSSIIRTMLVQPTEVRKIVLYIIGGGGGGGGWLPVPKSYIPWPFPEVKLLIIIIIIINFIE